MKIKKIRIVYIVLFILAYELVMFAYKAGVTNIVATHENPDTVYVFNKDSIRTLMEENGVDSASSVRVYAEHSQVSRQVVKQNKPRRYETFRFNPNTATVEEFERLGFTERQAQSFINYRKKGGKFKKKVQFQASPVVSDSIYERLKDYIYLPKIDINKADTAELQYLPSIGRGRANYIVQFRGRVRGFSYPEQLMDVSSIDYDVYNDLKDRVICSPNEPFPIWELSEDSLFLHPYIRYAADKIIKFKKKHKKEDWTIENLERAEVLREPYAYKLKRCNIKNP